MPEGDHSLQVISSKLSKLDSDQIVIYARSLQDNEQVDCPLDHFFSDGVYMRTILMPAGTMILGCKHKTRHINYVASGLALVVMEGNKTYVDAREKPVRFESDPGVVKCLYIIEPMIWTTIHVTGETDLKKLADLLIENPDDHAIYQLQIERQKLLAEFGS